MSYKVQFLNDEEFDKLPAVNIHQKVGVAYPESGEAYVRRTGSNVLDVFTALHELEHLEGDALGEHYDEDNKCYYKDFGQTLMAVAPLALSFIPGVGTALGGALSGIGSGISGALGAVPGIGGALSGAASSIGSGIGSALGIGGGGSAASQAPNVIKTGAASGMQGFAPNAGRLGAGYMGAGGQAAYDAAPNVLRTGAGISSMLGKAGRSVASDAASGLAQKMLGGEQSPMGQFMPQSQGSYNPQVQSQPNQIAGAGGTGSMGGPAGAPGGSLGGGAVSKLKAYLQQQGNGGNGAGGNF